MHLAIAGKCRASKLIAQSLTLIMPFGAKTHQDLLVGVINVAADIAWRTTVGFYAGNVMCKVLKFSQVIITQAKTRVQLAFDNMMRRTVKCLSSCGISVL